MKNRHLSLAAVALMAVCCSHRASDEARQYRHHGPRTPIAIDAQALDIAQAVFLHMFTHAEEWSQGINRRFVSVQGQCPPELLERLRAKSAQSVLSPFVFSERAYPAGRFVEGSYIPNDDDSLFYEISGLEERDHDAVYVWCSVRQGFLAGRGYGYTLERKNGEWTVTDTELLWIS